MDKLKQSGAKAEMADKISYAVKISSPLRKRVKEFCQAHGLKQGYFVERALEEKLKSEERLQDVLRIQKWRHQEPKAISFEQYLKERNV